MALMSDSTAALTVLHVESSKGWGGQENRTLNEMVCLRDMGHHCLLACQPGAKLGLRAREAGFPVLEVKMRSIIDVPAILALRSYMRRMEVDIVNTHSGRDTQLAGLAARSLWKRPRIVRTRHLALPITSRFTYSTLPDQVVTVSAYVGEYLAQAGVPRSHLTTVATGVDLTRYRRDPAATGLRDELGLPPECKLVGTVAILRRKKGHAELLDAIPAILRQHPHTHFVFAGDGPQRDNIEEKIQALGIGGHVHLLGLRRDIVNVLQSLDLFVLPTHQEALGTALIEAAALGLAAVASNVDGVPEAVVDGETGLLVPVMDSPALASAICNLLADDEKRSAMGKVAFARVQQLYSRETMARNMIALYRRLIAEAQSA